jgi:hypothetical protein
VSVPQPQRLLAVLAAVAGVVAGLVLTTGGIAFAASATSGDGALRRSFDEIVNALTIRRPDWVELAAAVSDTSVEAGYTTPFGATPIDVTGCMEVLLTGKVTAITGGTMTVWGYGLDSYTGTTNRIQDSWNQSPANRAQITAAPTTDTSVSVWLQHGLGPTTTVGGAATGYAHTISPGPFGTHVLVRKFVAQTVAPTSPAVALSLLCKK